MGNLGTGEFFSFIFSIFIIYLVVNAFINRGVVHLALSRFIVDPDSEDQIIIEGRKTGLWQWILVQLKLGNIYRITVKSNYISYSEESAAGNILELVPICKVSSTACGFRKPIGILILAVVFAALGILTFFVSSSFNIGAAFVLLIMYLFIAALLLVFYIYKKNFFITIETLGSKRLGFSFKRSFIENVPVETEQIQIAIFRINKLVLNERP